MEYLHQGDIVRIEKIKHPVLVVSKDFFNTSGEIIGCPIVSDSIPGPLHIWMSTEHTAGYVQCEKLALLATHAGNTSFHSFAAEIRWHGMFLVGLAKISLPFVGGSVYASAIRADMTIDDKEFEGPTPYYDPDSRLIQEQKRCHPEYSIYDI